MLSSKNETKQEARFAARLDVLTERVDTLASTVATTASAMAKREGEIAALRKELAVRDEQLADFVTRAREANTGGGDDVRELKAAVAALASDAGGGKRGSSKQLDDVVAKVGLLGQRLDTLATTVSTTAAGLAGREGELAVIRKQLESAPAGGSGERAGGADPELRNQLAGLSAVATRLEARLDAHTAQLDGLESQLADREAAPSAPPSDELRAMLAMLRTRVESLDALRAGVTEEMLEDRLSGTNDALARLSQRVDDLATSIETATARRTDKEHELAALHRHFVESSTRIETIVVDLREALGALEETDPAALTALTGQVESALADIASVASRVERLEVVHADDLVSQLTDRVEAVDKRLESVAVEIARAKTLWPVALRSLEARLDDVVAPRQLPVPADDATPPEPEPHHDDVEDDLLAELRDSLQAMESVAAEIERASEGSADPDLPDVPDQQAVAGGARIVPLRASDP
jgi:chromosome segregation ATPase